MKNAQKIEKVPLVGQSLEKIILNVQEMGFPKFRGKQIFQWLYQHRVNDFSDMKNVPNAIREKCGESFNIHPLELKLHTQSNQEPTEKFLFTLKRGENIESVLMKDRKRNTICISTQVGCAVDCDFCATAKMGFQKNLTVGEIVDQFIQVQNLATIPITNIVFMGMGEPFLNYKNVISAADLLNHPEGTQMGARRITISTAGVVSKIKQFAEEKHKYKLAISLNASNESVRKEIMPITKTHGLNALMEAADIYYQSSGRFPTFEYVLMEGINDSLRDAHDLTRLIGRQPCKLNVIPYNEIGGYYKRPSDDKIKSFLSQLKNVPFQVTVRWSRGTDIKAGCGQLAASSDS
ncbi:MAG: 23S rRNA (adenine(2503)-C(2))-methyltransferase RlmN [Candidatus Marinimicrobia bacterium]|nr:23S rRNA (adenine(2503)-C(2))-methyltransferase RlmN [Candidatus Neomarinimicrobiota bacterium]MBT3937972.1 23S rRNA (adenine(2503)-C(2))-methyltransferase RlmN [Candidatus Neomarinimicrobiota bacterium]MBT3962230.1 23S rRNA (adenine(2503)-C(2))-methyltransferase RlmN [Candidatus Neomarinimicrobiota bacterium]MBT4383803.1 23S rRNA (adenine(2503)-C(2))-methyltransferase RlmN [Candidatus Neomarinimicrobiota bacterium]MBT4636905.1 23S rRNA (adenine(2503)-C(2))-methyltransferase RlmN [Candidatus